MRAILWSLKYSRQVCFLSFVICPCLKRELFINYWLAGCCNWFDFVFFFFSMVVNSFTSMLFRGS